jgi:hypothetical protein
VPDPRRDRIADALTRPLNVVVPAAVLTAGALTSVLWLVLVAVVCWLALVAMTLLEEGPPPAPALGPAIAGRLQAAGTARASIRAAIETSDLPLGDLLVEVDALVAAIESHARRAQRIHEFLRERPAAGIERRLERETNPQVAAALAAQLDALARLRGHLDALLSAMDHVVASLDTVHAEVLAAESAGDTLGQHELASRVSQLRTHAQLVSAGLQEAFADTRSHLAE